MILYIAEAITKGRATIIGVYNNVHRAMEDCQAQAVGEIYWQGLGERYDGVGNDTKYLIRMTEMKK